MSQLTPHTRIAPRFDTAKFNTASAECGCSHPHAPDETRAARPDAGNSRYSWQVEGMDCAACARKVENAARRVSGVHHAQVLFATQKLLVDAPMDVRQEVERAVQRAGYTLYTQDTPPVPDKLWQQWMPILLITALMALSYGITRMSPLAGRLAFVATTLFGLWPIVTQALRLTRSGSFFTIETLMSVACIGALIIGAATEAAMVLLLFMIGEQLETFAAARARRGVTALMALRPDQATVIREGQRQRVDADQLRPGDIVEVAAGERLPADALLQDAAASFDESALTGESIPVERASGERISAGATSIDRKVTLKVVSEPGDSAIDRILRLIEEADERRAPVERFIEKFSRIYTPIIMLLALLCATVPPLVFGGAWFEWIYKSLALLLIGCPCALVISTPAAITSGLAAAARYGVLIKGGAALEQLSRIHQMAFDKTGTLTAGRPSLSATLPAPGFSQEQLLEMAAGAENGASHPLAKALVAAAASRGLILPQAENQLTRAGVGIEATVDGVKVVVSAPDKARTQQLDAQWRKHIAELESQGQTVVVVTAEDKLAGILGLRDTLREDAQTALHALNDLGVHTVMLTGDNPRAAQAIAGQLKIDFRAGLLPADKVTEVATLNKNAPLAMVGDGINDAPAMKTASLGIAMGGGTDVALESADAALTHNRLMALPQVIQLARATRRNIRQNIGIALGLKGVFLITTLLGLTGLWLAVLADSGATALVTANALRLLRRRN